MINNNVERIWFHTNRTIYYSYKALPALLRLVFFAGLLFRQLASSPLSNCRPLWNHNHCNTTIATMKLEEGTGDLKQLLQDVEASTYDLEEITLEYLTNVNPRFYGPSHNGTEEQKASRRKVTQALTNLKRMRRGSPAKYQAYLIANGVSPGPRTVALVQSASGFSAGQADGSKDLPENFGYMSLKESPQIQPPPRTPPRTPPRFPTTQVRAPYYSPGYSPGIPTSALVPTVPDLDELSGSFASGLLDTNITETQLLGMLYKPNIILADLNHFERHPNGYKVNVVSSQTVGVYECKSIMIWKQYDAPDIMSAEASIATQDYLSTLASLGNFPYENRECVLVKSPAIEFGNQCEEGSRHTIHFPNDACKQAVMTAQGNLDEARRTNHDLFVFPEEIGFDNRVFSDDDFAIKVVRSMPDSYKEDEVDDKLLIWHNFWNIAIKGTAHKKMKAKKKSIKEEKALMKQRL